MPYGKPIQIPVPKNEVYVDHLTETGLDLSREVNENIIYFKLGMLWERSCMLRNFSSLRYPSEETLFFYYTILFG
jgi:hypothetical protein